MVTAEATIPHTADADRVRSSTHPLLNARIDRQARTRVQEDAAGSDIGKRLPALAQEWDIERVIETEAAVTGLLGLALAVSVDRRFLILPAVATTMLLTHAVHAWYPLLPILRRIGIRTQDEIEQERYALKVLRGDFGAVRSQSSDRRAEAAWRAVQL